MYSCVEMMKITELDNKVLQLQYIKNMYTWIFQVCVVFCSFTKRQTNLLDFFRIAFCLQNRLSENHELETALTKFFH